MNVFIQARHIWVECCSVVTKQEGVLEGVLLLAGEVLVYQLLNVALHSSTYRGQLQLHPATSVGEIRALFDRLTSQLLRYIRTYVHYPQCADTLNTVEIYQHQIISHTHTRMDTNTYTLPSQKPADVHTAATTRVWLLDSLPLAACPCW